MKAPGGGVPGNFRDGGAGSPFFAAMTVHPSPQPAEGGAGPSAVPMDATPQRAMVVTLNPRAHVCLCGRIPIKDMGPLLLASAHPLSRARGGEWCTWIFIHRTKSDRDHD